MPRAYISPSSAGIPAPHPVREPWKLVQLPSSQQGPAHAPLAAAPNRFLHFLWPHSCRGRGREADCSMCLRTVLVLRRTIHQTISQVGPTQATQTYYRTQDHPAAPPRSSRYICSACSEGQLQVPMESGLNGILLALDPSGHEGRQRPVSDLPQVVTLTCPWISITHALKDLAKISPKAPAYLF